MPFYAQVDSDGRIFSVMRTGQEMPTSERIFSVDSYDPSMIGGRIVEGKVIPPSELVEEAEALPE